MSLLEVTDLSVCYGGAVHALEGVSLAVPEGGAVALMGANGAGKTTLLRAVSGLLAYHQGRVLRGGVRVAGRSMTGHRPRSPAAVGIAHVLEGRRVFAGLTVAENLRVGGIASPRRDRELSRAHVLELFPALRDRLEQPAGLLSGGEQSMLALGRALMARPRLLLLDEPSLGLAPLVIDGIGRALREINDAGIAILIVDQNPRLARAVASHGVVLEAGRIVRETTTAELLDDDTLSHAYLGAPRC